MALAIAATSTTANFLFLISHMRSNASTTPARKLFVATRVTQGKRASDFCFVATGELLRFSTECDGERVDGPCGCRRSLVGIDCHKATTTFVVQETPLSEEEFAEKITSSYAAAGFDKFLTSLDAREEATQLMQLASAFPTGCVVEKRGNKFVNRAR